MTQPNQYPEHDKLSAIADESQAQGEFLDWLSSQGIHLMTWREWEEEADCPACTHTSEAAERRCAEQDRCRTCHGTHEVMRTRRGWVDNGRSVQQLLADYHGIDQKKIEAEKRAMLVSLRGGDPR